MAPVPAGVPPVLYRSCPGWAAFHLFYQGSRDRLLVELVRPLVCRLWRRGDVRRFFFLRYALGGPHVRLRLDCTPGRREQVLAAVEDLAAEFFRRSPSQTVLDEEAIRETNRRLRASDAEAEDVIYPNNTWIELPFRAEVARYGGEELLEPSLDFFALSSVDALCFAAAFEAAPRPSVLGAVFRRFAALALRLASQMEDFSGLLEHAASWSQGARPSSGALGDEAFVQRPQVYCAVLRREVEAILEPERLPSGSSASALLPAAGSRLALAIAGAEPGIRRSIGAAQLHMMVNRLGLDNTEEAYLGRLLWRAAQELRRSDPALWSEADEALRGRGRPGNGATPSRLSEMIPIALDSLCADAGSSAGDAEEPVRTPTG